MPANNKTTQCVQDWKDNALIVLFFIVGSGIFLSSTLAEMRSRYERGSLTDGVSFLILFLLEAIAWWFFASQCVQWFNISISSTYISHWQWMVGIIFVLTYLFVHIIFCFAAVIGASTDDNVDE